MTYYWDLGNGTKLSGDAIPYQYGTDDYYQYIADKRRSAAGDTGPHKSDRLQQLEAGLAADKNALPEWQRAKDWQDAHNKNAGEYAKALADYNQQVLDWKRGGDDYVRSLDHTGQAPAGYTFVQDGPGGSQAAGAGLGAATAGAYEGIAGHWQSTDPFYSGGGKAGGAGNANPATAPDNSWNDAWGQDVRTDEQKYYDRNMSRWDEVADANGTYHWYGTETGYDSKDPNASRRVDATELAMRGSSPDGVRPGQGAGAGGGGFARDQYWNYNQGKTSSSSLSQPNLYNESWFNDQIRNRKDLSTWGRTG